MLGISSSTSESNAKPARMDACAGEGGGSDGGGGERGGGEGGGGDDGGVREERVVGVAVMVSAAVERAVVRAVAAEVDACVVMFE